METDAPSKHSDSEDTKSNDSSSIQSHTTLVPPPKVQSPINANGMSDEQSNHPPSNASYEKFMDKKDDVESAPCVEQQPVIQPLSATQPPPPPSPQHQQQPSIAASVVVAPSQIEQKVELPLQLQTHISATIQSQQSVISSGGSQHQSPIIGQPGHSTIHSNQSQVSSVVVTQSTPVSHALPVIHNASPSAHNVPQPPSAVSHNVPQVSHTTTPMPQVGPPTSHPSVQIHTAPVVTANIQSQVSTPSHPPQAPSATQEQAQATPPPQSVVQSSHHQGPPPHHMPPHMGHQGLISQHPNMAPHPAYGGYAPQSGPPRSPYYPPQYAGHPQPYQYAPYPYHQQYAPPPSHYMGPRPGGPPMHYSEHGVPSAHQSLEGHTGAYGGGPGGTAVGGNNPDEGDKSIDGKNYHSMTYELVTRTNINRHKSSIRKLFYLRFAIVRSAFSIIIIQ